jgi:lipoprotein-releasing system ATP-binding protein
MNEIKTELLVQDLTKAFESGSDSIPILSGINLQMSEGNALAVTGPSGSGKSTFLYIIGTLESPTSGTVTISGENPFEKNETELALFRNQTIGFIFQDHHLLPQCNVLENVLLPTLAADQQKTEQEETARKLLDRVGLSHRLTHRPSRLSGGERQRVAVCRALINNPSIILADEPTGNLDQKSANEIGSLLLELCEEQKKILICVTHSLELAGRFPQNAELTSGTFQTPVFS